MTHTIGWGAILDDELARHPGMDGADLRKLVYQSALGGDHLLGDPVRFADGVRAEWERLAPPGVDPPGSALQTIDPEGRTARIHLAACRASGVRVDRLVEVLLAQPRKNASVERFERSWRAMLVLAEAGAIPFRADALLGLDPLMGSPHHSDGYGPAAYRIVNDLTDRDVRDGLQCLGIFR